MPNADSANVVSASVNSKSASAFPQVTLDYAQPKQYERTLQGIFSFLDRQDKLIVVAVDEFQQITQYPEKNIEAVLRAQIQKLKNVRFVFSGSSPHLLAQMFHHVKRPFFASTQTVELNEIDADEYRRFIHELFEAYKRKVTDDALDFILFERNGIEIPTGSFVRHPAKHRGAVEQRNDLCQRNGRRQILLRL